MGLVRRLTPFFILTVVALTAAGVTTATAAPPTTPTLVGIRAAHHPTFDRIVFDFRGGLPTTHEAAYVPQLIGDASGLPVPIAGRAILRVRFSPAVAHTENGTATAPNRIAFGLPNIITAVRAGDFEAVTTYGVSGWPHGSGSGCSP